MLCYAMASFKTALADLETDPPIPPSTKDIEISQTCCCTPSHGPLDKSRGPCPSSAGGVYCARASTDCLAAIFLHFIIFRNFSSTRPHPRSLAPVGQERQLAASKR